MPSDHTDCVDCCACGTCDCLTLTGDKAFAAAMEIVNNPDLLAQSQADFWKAGE